MRLKILRLLAEKKRITLTEMQSYFPSESKENIYGEICALQFEGLLKLDYEPILIAKDS